MQTTHPATESGTQNGRRKGTPRPRFKLSSPGTCFTNGEAGAPAGQPRMAVPHDKGKFKSGRRMLRPYKGRFELARRETKKRFAARRRNGAMKAKLKGGNKESRN